MKPIQDKSPLRTRMAPSPTGLLHIGTAHTTMFNYFLAHKFKGSFILRIDDTDQARNKPEFEDDIKENLKWLGLQWDEGPDREGSHGPYYQSQRTDLYQSYVVNLLETGHAYRCFCTPEELEQEKQASQSQKEPVYKYSGKCRMLTSDQIKSNLNKKKPYTIRVRTDFVEEVVVDDQIRGPITAKASDFGDFIVVRSDGNPVLLLTTTVDDITMQITHAIRGEDMLNVSFRQYFIFKALNQEMPKYAHKPFIYSMQGKKLSKRDGATSVKEFRDQGYLPEALLNYLFFVGYTPNDDQKALYSMEEMIEDFDFSNFQKSMPKFDYRKLLWYNAQYIKRLKILDLAHRFKSFVPEYVHDELLVKLTPLVSERLNTLSEITNIASFMWEDEITIPEFGWKDAAPEQLQAAYDQLQKLEDWKLDSINQTFMSLIETNNWKTGHFFMNLRLAVSGQNITPPINESIEILGKDKTLPRLQQAISHLRK